MIRITYDPHPDDPITPFLEHEVASLRQADEFMNDIREQGGLVIKWVEFDDSENEEESTNPQPTPHNPMIHLAVTGSEHATILAALRFYQEEELFEPDLRSARIHAIATNDGATPGLQSAAEIDRLCERINTQTRNNGIAPETLAFSILQEIVTSPQLLACRTFSELHDHCDANMLGDEIDSPSMEVTAAAQDLVNGFLKALHAHTPDPDSPENTLIIIWNHDDPDFEPALFVPPSARDFGLIIYDKAEELGGREPNTDRHHAGLIESHEHPTYPHHRPIGS